MRNLQFIETGECVALCDYYRSWSNIYIAWIPGVGNTWQGVSGYWNVKYDSSSWGWDNVILTSIYDIKYEIFSTY